MQYLATDLAALLSTDEESGGGAPVSMDPLVKQLRDKTVPQQPPGVPNYEVDAVLAAARAVGSTTSTSCRTQRTSRRRSPMS